MIRFRCWYCNRKYAVPECRAGQRITCNCQHLLRLPKRSGGSCKVKTLTDWLIEAVVYGGGGAGLGFLLSLAILTRAYFITLRAELALIGVCTLIGFLAGTFGGESGVNLIGGMIRQHQDD
jgi:hypothetical protein